MPADVPRLTMSPLVSICIPAWERPDFLAASIESCLAQTYPDVEIVVTDDSRTDSVGRLVERYQNHTNVRYLWNPERLGQARNVNRLFEVARGDRLVILHDDDTLLPNAVELLDGAWRQDPATLIAYGKQLVLTHNGEPLPTNARKYDEFLRRLAAGGPQTRNNLWYALAGHFPSNGFMTLTRAARRIRYRDAPEVGDACDLDFNIRLAQQPGTIAFVNDFVSTYRITDVSVSTESDTVQQAFFILESLDLTGELKTHRDGLLRAQLIRTVRSEIVRGRYAVALRLMRQYGMSPRLALAPGSLGNLLLLCLPAPLAAKVVSLKRPLRRRLRKSGLLYQLRALKQAVFTRS